MRLFLSSLGLAGIMAVSAFGATTPVLGPGSPAPSPFDALPDCQAATGGAGNCSIFSYDLSLAASTKLDTTQTERQLLVIYDFAGFTGYYESVTGNWSLVDTPLVGPLGVGGANLNAPLAWFPVAPDPGDNPLIENLVFEWTGGELVGALDLFDVLTIESIHSQTTTSFFRGQGTKNTPTIPTEHERAHQTSSSVTVPAPIPEPSSLALLGSALMGLGMLRLRAKK